MIAQLRVDDRLIHGQVALVWTKELDTPGIVVANVGRFTKDADNAIQLSSTLMMTPEELEALKELAKLDIPVFHQIVPNNAKTPISSILKDAN